MKVVCSVDSSSTSKYMINIFSQLLLFLLMKLKEDKVSGVEE